MAANTTITLTEILSNETVLIVSIVQFILGLVAGYFSAKVAKYIIGIIGVYLLGALLGVWGTAKSVDEAVKRIEELSNVKDTLKNIATAYGFALVGPTSIGFLVGLIVGILK